MCVGLSITLSQDIQVSICLEPVGMGMLGFYQLFFWLPKSEQNFPFSAEILQPNFVLFLRGGADLAIVSLD